MCDDNCNCGNDHSHDHEECDCGCGCGGHDEEYMTLTLEDNTEVKCTVIDIFEANNREYIALLPVGDDEVLLYRYIDEEDSENFALENIETDEEFQVAEEVFFSFFEDGIFDEMLFEDGEEYEYEDEVDNCEEE